MNSFNIVKNNCIGCGVDMGSQNPRQYCNKTFCPDEYPSEEDESKEISHRNNSKSHINNKSNIESWVCGECTITNYTEKCLLCDYTRGDHHNLSQKISYGLASTARAVTKF
tara:strand:- start:790 stop:1122 length:333 start_codon:yes stop_codon:yes gene_type:complete